MNECKSNQSECIPLAPFFHQVGGHSSMFQYDSTTVCKVLDQDELHFYQSMPEFLKKFVPEFRGIITAHYSEDQSGYVKFFARPQTPCKTPDENCSSNDRNETSNNAESTNATTTELNARRSVQLRCSADGQVEYFNGLGNDLGNYEQGQITVSKINPWTLQLCKKQTEKFHRQYLVDENGSVSQNFLLLENVAARFRHPCILDLKMGKRQHAEIDSDKKRQSKIEKCQLSTSSTLGVRLCGMQVYQVDHGRYIFTDKYRGRLLTVDGFRSALVEFINNGRTKRWDILPGIIERLQLLHETITRLVNYRFYSGSLLIVYDGFPSSDLIDLRMIDFAHSILLQSSEEIDPDRDYLFGLERLIDVFREILANQNDSQQVH